MNTEAQYLSIIGNVMISLLIVHFVDLIHLYCVEKTNGSLCYGQEFKEIMWLQIEGRLGILSWVRFIDPFQAMQVVLFSQDHLMLFCVWLVGRQGTKKLKMWLILFLQSWTCLRSHPFKWTQESFTCIYMLIRTVNNVVTFWWQFLYECSNATIWQW